MLPTVSRGPHSSLVENMAMPLAMNTMPMTSAYPTGKLSESYLVLSYPILSYGRPIYHPIHTNSLLYPILSYPILSYLVLSCIILSYLSYSYPTLDPIKRTQQPIVTGTSVLGIKYKDGVMLAADTLASYGSLAR